MTKDLPYRVIGFYRPSRWRALDIGRDLTNLTQGLGLEPHVDPRHGPLPLKGRNWVSPLLHAEVRRRTFKTQMAEGWHFDGDTTEGSRPDCLLCLWASNNPTEIRRRSTEGTFGATMESLQKIYQPRPYEVVLFKNLECLHRRPPSVPRVRWIFRQRLALKGDIL